MIVGQRYNSYAHFCQRRSDETNFISFLLPENLESPFQSSGGIIRCEISFCGEYAFNIEICGSMNEPELKTLDNILLRVEVEISISLEGVGLFPFSSAPKTTLGLTPNKTLIRFQALIEKM